MTSDAAQSRAKRRLSLILAGGHCRRRGRAGGGIRDQPVARQIGRRPGLPAGGRDGAADRAVRPRRGRRHDRGGAADPAAGHDLPRRHRRRAQAVRLARAHRAVQSLGHLVRALPQGDAGARRTAGQARRRRFRGGRGEYRHARSGQAAAPGSRRSASSGSPITPTPPPRCFRISSRPARPGACRPRILIDARGLRDRHAGGPGGMGERGRDQARQRGARQGAGSASN